MFKVTVIMSGEKTFTQYQTLTEAKNHIENLHRLFQGAGQICGQHYQMELSEI